MPGHPLRRARRRLEPDAQTDGGFKWNWCSWWVGKDLVGNFVKMWELVPTNKTVGRPLGQRRRRHGLRQRPAGAFQRARLHARRSRPFEPGTEDFTAIISQFKKNGVELVCGMANPPEFTNYVKQCAQQAFQPKITTCAKALLFPSAVDALGDLGDGMTVESWYHPEVRVQERRHRHDRSAVLRRLRSHHRPAVDPAHLLHRLLRAVDRRPQARQEPDGQGLHRGSHQGDQGHPHRRPGRLDRQPRAEVRLLQLLRQAARRRPVGQGHHGQAQVRAWNSWPACRTPPTSRSPPR